MAPPDVKARHRLSPPSFIADVVVDILASPTTGAVCVAMWDAPGGVWQYEAALLAPPALEARCRETIATEYSRPVRHAISTNRNLRMAR